MMKIRFQFCPFVYRRKVIISLILMQLTWGGIGNVDDPLGVE